MHRRVLALLSVTAAALATVALTSAPAVAGADNRIPLPGVTEVGDVAAGGGRILVAAGDRVVVADRLGAVTGSVGGLAGAVGLALTADGSRAYVALRDANQIAELDPARLRVVRRIDLPAHPCPTSLALARGRLWVGYGCPNTGRGGVLSLDVAARRPAPVPVVADLQGVPLVAAAGSVLAFGERSMSPGSVQVFSTRADGTTTRRGGVGSDTANLQDLALTPDGRLLVTASGYPYRHIGWDTTTLAEVRGYGAEEGGYPTAVAISRDGTQVAAGRYFGVDLSLHATGTGETLHRASAEGDLVAGALAFAGRDVVGALTDTQSGTFFLWVARDPTLPGSTLTLTGPATATAGSPLTLTGRLTLAGGTAPGAQRLTVTRRTPDGTTTALPAVTTGTGGRFTARDPAPVGGEVTYTVDWAGSRTHRGADASVVVSVARIPLTLTLTGPAMAAAGEQVRLTGTVRTGGAVPAPVTLAAYRITSNNFGTSEDALGEVTSTATGDFAFTDTPPAGGQVTYEVRRAETDLHEAGQAAHAVGVTSRVARITGVLQWPTYVGDEYPVYGQIEYETDQCAGPTTVHVSRQVGDGPVEARPDVTTDAACAFTFVDTVANPGNVRYVLRWDGDAAHDPATGEITGTVSRIPTELDVQPVDQIVAPGQPVRIGGLLTARFTTPQSGQPLTVTRVDWIGRSVELPGVTTGPDGRFAFTDTLPEVPLEEFPSFSYEVRYAGTATHAPAFGSTQVFVREGGD